MANYINYSYEQLNKFCTDAFKKFGFNDEQCKIIVDVLLTSDLYGIESHGMQRLVRYHKGIEKGLIHVQAKVRNAVPGNGFKPADFCVCALHFCCHAFLIPRSMHIFCGRVSAGRILNIIIAQFIPFANRDFILLDKEHDMM